MKKNISFFAVVMLISLFGVNLMAQTPQYYNSNSGSSQNSFPFNMAAGKAVNWLILPGELSLPTPVPVNKKITKVYFRAGTAGAPTCTNFEILMAQSTITTLTSGSFYAGPWDTVYFHASASLTSTAGGWTQVVLDHGFNYDPTKSLIFFVGQCGYSGSGFTVYQATQSNVRRVWSVGGCPFSPYASGDSYIVDFGVDVVDAGVPQYYNSNSSSSSNNYPFNVAGGESINLLYLPGDFSQPTPLPSGQRITDVYFRAQTPGTRNFTDLEILMAQSSITTLTPGVFYAGPWDTVYYHASASITFTGWMHLTLDHGFTYDPGQSLIISAGQCSSNGSPLLNFFTILANTRRVYSSGGCPFVAAGGDGCVYDFGVDVVASAVGFNQFNPKSFELLQNYPNPFNQYTTIFYQLASKTDVVLKVYDVMGKEVTTLVNTNQIAGKYEVKFDATNLAPGMYVFQLTTNNFSQSKRMMIQK